MINLSSAILDPLLRADPVGPRITYYDDATGERIELSAATLANWAAKTGNLLRDELGAGAGSRIAVLLPAHWQTAAVLFGAWWIGAEVLTGSDADADVALCTADRLDEADAAVAATGGEVVVLSLDPFGKPAPDLPVGVTDYATAVRVHGDQIIAERAPGPALAGSSADDVLASCEKCAATLGLTSSDRVWSTRDWNNPTELIENMLTVFAVGGSLVQVANPDPGLQERRRASEKVTRLFD
ncbi:acetyl-CoA synthetase [Mycolicibacter heraklionensis]|uniref:Acetyl-CoA synthetase n=1 Tax=Mycolicibacter heraklionensis TaxID=512402 RepID=A0A9X7WFU4_9MYCO|nr:TIGR03089 family protein [Mycolicibacter heraklionensis]KLO29730.1 acetyl-CoA synthetase [Mycolicibacter heraklionensis]QZA06699.1 TIGR03089 family protein [Mycolicibacter heraklionensis]